MHLFERDGNLHKRRSSESLFTLRLLREAGSISSYWPCITEHEDVWSLAYLRRPLRIVVVLCYPSRHPSLPRHPDCNSTPGQDMRSLRVTGNVTRSRGAPCCHAGQPAGWIEGRQPVRPLNLLRWLRGSVAAFLSETATDGKLDLTPNLHPTRKWPQ